MTSAGGNPSSACDIGLIGLAVMGENLALNIESRGFRVAVFNRTTSVVDKFIADAAAGKRIVGAYSVEELVGRLGSPRKVLLMVKAGPAVDELIRTLVPLLSPGDIIIDGGNTLYTDTERRVREVEARGLSYIGTGVSGGEEGALRGPSLMPGGSPQAWPAVRPIFQAIAAKVGPNRDIPCCDWVGPGGAGHYVKMVHNGIEYGDMQLICESYFLLSRGLGLSNAELYDVFDEWNRGELDSYLIEITRDIFSVKDPETGGDLLDMIQDTAGSKGTGKWMSQLALDLGVPTTLITEAVFARYLSSLKDARVRASQILRGPTQTGEPPSASPPSEPPGRAPALAGRRRYFTDAVSQALYASKICSYAQGFFQLQAAAREHNWPLDFGRIALLWRGGCIIRAQFLERIKEAFDRQRDLENLLLDSYFREAVERVQDSWRHVVSTAVTLGIPIPGFSAALAYFDGYRQERLPANLLQAQRDYFGAHTYERTDRPGVFHTDWFANRKPPR